MVVADGDVVEVEDFGTVVVVWVAASVVVGEGDVVDSVEESAATVVAVEFVGGFVASAVGVDG